MKSLFYNAKMLVAALLLTTGLHAVAQDVTISPASGRLIAGLGSEGEFGFEEGWKSIWWHNQLPLKLIVSDDELLNDDGFPVHHACNLYRYKKDWQGNEKDRLIVASTKKCYMVLTLPVGFAITGYELTVKNDLPASDRDDSSISNTWNRDGHLYETNKEFDTGNPYEQVTINRTKSTTEYTIKRTILNKADNTNILYFVFEANANTTEAELAIENFVVYFSAEGDFNVTIEPTEDDAQCTSYREIPFLTGKLALGDIRRRYANVNNGAYHYAYEYHEVENLDANMLLYQENAVLDGKVAEVSEKTITQEVENFGTENVRHAFGLKNNTYYIESPIEAVTTHGNHDPIGYRITDAKLYYHYGAEQAAVSETVTHNAGMFTISATLNLDNDASQGTSVYYLHPSGRFVRAQSGETTTKLWQMDDKGRVFHKQGKEYAYLEWSVGSRYNIRIHTSTNDPATEYSNSYSGRYYRTENSTTYYNNFNAASGTNRLRFGASSSYHYVHATWDSKLAAYKISQSTTATDGATWNDASSSKQVNQPKYIPKPWTLTVYDKDGETVKQIVKVGDRAEDDGTDGFVELTGLNNDAIKFKIEGLPDDDEESYRAIFHAEVTMQALDPYINSLDIKCTDAQNVNSIVQQFAATNFAVKGGKFKFYVPANWSEAMPCTFSFENLRTNYLDKTYYNGNNDGNARNSLIGSEYYPTGSYKNVYDITAPNALSAEADDYTKKVSTLLCGTQPFYFSNADELDHDIATNDIRTLHQYQFSLERYASQTRTQRTNGSGETIYTGQPAGEFKQLTMSGDDEKVAYLFVCDEPRYNIAPTKATEHRMYAYYDMDIELITKDYSPKLTWTKLYDEVDYTGTGIRKDSQWGLKIETTAGSGEPGYLPMSLIYESIDNRQADNVEAPKTLSQILYVDASPLSTIIYASNVGNADNAVIALKKKLGKNALFYLPYEMSQDDDNFAYIDATNTFHACNNIVLTDGEAFYAPYEISVDASNAAVYKRGITASGYNKTTLGTLMLPFNLTVNDEGVHHETDNESAFRLFNMQSMNSLSMDKDDLNSGAVGYFKGLKSDNVVRQTEANRPYLFEVTNQLSDRSTTLIASQYGATIEATETAENLTTDKLLKGEASTGTIGGTKYNLQHMGTYSGACIPKAEGCFYMAQGKFLNTLSLNNNLPALNMLPFRSWYTCETGKGTKPSLMSFRIVFGENNSDVTAIGGLTGTDDLLITTGQGTLTLRSGSDRSVSIYSVGGYKAVQVSLQAGVSQTLSLPSGIYVVNQTKIIVK